MDDVVVRACVRRPECRVPGERRCLSVALAVGCSYRSRERNASALLTWMRIAIMLLRFAVGAIPEIARLCCLFDIVW